MGRSRKRGHHRWVLSLANSALKWPFWGPVSLHDPKSKVAQVTSNDQKSKGSRLAWITWITWHQLIWLLYPIIYRVSYMLGGWPWDFSSPSTWFYMTGPPTNPPWPVSLQARWSSDPIRSELKGPLGIRRRRVFFTRCFLNFVGHFDEVLCLFLFLKIDIRIYLFMKIF